MKILYSVKLELVFCWSNMATSSYFLRHHHGHRLPSSCARLPRNTVRTEPNRLRHEGSSSCMFAQACVPVYSSYPYQPRLKYTLQHCSVCYAIGRPACFNPNICICTQLLANHSIMDGLGFRISDNVTLLLCHKDKQHSNRTVTTKFLETFELMKRSLKRDPFGAIETRFKLQTSWQETFKLQRLEFPAHSWDFQAVRQVPVQKERSSMIKSCLLCCDTVLLASDLKTLFAGKSNSCSLPRSVCKQ